MSRPTVKFFDSITEEEIIREMNDEEYEVHLRDLERIEKDKAAIEAAEAKRQALLDKLGITEEEAKLLLS